MIELISDYGMLRVIWWILLGVLLTGFAAMDGFDMGVGILLPFVAKTDIERRVAINTVGPVWEGNQVWLILGGGAIFAAWPALYAVSFSGFYLAMFLVLLALILRPVGFKYRSKKPDRCVADPLGLGALHRRRRAGPDLRRGGRQCAARRSLSLYRRSPADLRGQPVRPSEPGRALLRARLALDASHAWRCVACVQIRRARRRPRESVRRQGGLRFFDPVSRAGGCSCGSGC